jgi:ABC-type nitrate/sulfonate/bicarbonate transport system substrate-binding protein
MQYILPGLEEAMKNLAITALAIALFLFSPPAVSRAAIPPTKVVIAYSTFNERGAGALMVARDLGFFRKQGLDANLIYVRSGAVALSALAADEAQLYFGSSTGSTLGAMAGGLDAVFVAGLVNKFVGTFVVAPTIQSPNDLKGKNIGIQSVGGGIWMITVLLLDHWGLDPKRDNINLRVLGDESVLSQSLVSGNIDATFAGHTYAAILKRQGFKVLADLANLGIPYQSTGAIVRRSFINSSSGTLEKVIRALVEAIAFIQKPGNKAAVVSTLVKGLHLERTEEGEEGYETMKSVYERRPYPNLEGINNSIKLLGINNEKIRRLKAESVVDDSIVRKLEKEGLF